MEVRWVKRLRKWQSVINLECLHRDIELSGGPELRPFSIKITNPNHVSYCKEAMLAAQWGLFGWVFFNQRKEIHIYYFSFQDKYTLFPEQIRTRHNFLPVKE